MNAIIAAKNQKMSKKEQLLKLAKLTKEEISKTVNLSDVYKKNIEICVEKI